MYLYIIFSQQLIFQKQAKRIFYQYIVTIPIYYTKYICLKIWRIFHSRQNKRTKKKTSSVFFMFDKKITDSCASICQMQGCCTIQGICANVHKMYIKQIFATKYYILKYACATQIFFLLIRNAFAKIFQCFYFQQIHHIKDTKNFPKYVARKLKNIKREENYTNITYI